MKPEKLFIGEKLAWYVINGRNMARKSACDCIFLSLESSETYFDLVASKTQFFVV